MCVSLTKIFNLQNQNRLCYKIENHIAVPDTVLVGDIAVGKELVYLFVFRYRILYKIFEHVLCQKEIVHSLSTRVLRQKYCS